MAIDTVSSSTANSSTQLNLQDFMRILTSQLNNQDPMKPMDNTEFMAQLAQFTALEQSRQLNTKLDALLSVQSANQSIGLIGRNVDVQLESGPVSGQITQLDLSSGEPRLSLRLASGTVIPNLPLSQISAVR
ncbi:flagellar hook assembly protein FlgD [Methylibium rhizosphaerae]|jgi:flagellar basal-body rod modification protein FlgD|uniref:flagellar hook assembly protein FlgD n=1 Tax=Methylibium rhizosphaerae TaxID=2570323 RepID=UPI00112D3D5B|nr:flagellar hook capping FlgD N-terminal domain-containing protein [Methylibium rhizosphaerae]